MVTGTADARPLCSLAPGAEQPGRDANGLNNVDVAAVREFLEEVPRGSKVSERRRTGRSRMGGVGDE